MHVKVENAVPYEDLMDFSLGFVHHSACKGFYFANALISRDFVHVQGKADLVHANVKCGDFLGFMHAKAKVAVASRNVGHARTKNAQFRPNCRSECWLHPLWNNSSLLRHGISRAGGMSEYV